MSTRSVFKKRRGFFGTMRQVVDRTQAEQLVSASSRKLAGSELPEPTPPCYGSAEGYRLIDLKVLQTFLSDVLGTTCSRCQTETMVFHEEDGRRQGLMSVLCLKCTRCGQKTGAFETSEKRQLPGAGRSYDVNHRAAFASLVMGESRAGIEQFCAIMGMPPPPLEQSWTHHMKSLAKTLEQTAGESMKKAVGIIRQTRSQEQGRAIPEDELLDEIVSFDGAWTKRGHSSLFGIQAVIHMDTGKVLDTQVHSKLCLVCRGKEEEHPDVNSDDYKAWKANHEPACTRNTEKSSNAMEAQGALDIWSRSVEKNKMRYTTFLGDGDSKGWKIVCDAKPYGDDVEIKKADCIGHVQKRMGNRLRGWKKQAKQLEDNKTAGGKGSLTDETIDRLQRYYGRAIRSHVHDVDGMSTATRAILHHLVLPFAPSIRKPWPGLKKGRKGRKQQSEAAPEPQMTRQEWEDNETSRLAEEEKRHHSCPRTVADQHQFCPLGPDSWCKFQQDRANDTSNYAQEGLPHIFFDELKPTFDKLSNHALLERCKDGFTQNQNESFHSVIWSYAPKHKFYGYNMVRSATNLATSYFNDGAVAYYNAMTAMAMPVNSISLKAMKRMDTERVQFSERRAQEEIKLRRVEVRRKKKRKGDEEKRSEGTTYMAGAFGDEDNAEEPPSKRCRTAKGKKKPKQATQVLDDAAERQDTRAPCSLNSDETGRAATQPSMDTDEEGRSSTSLLDHPPPSVPVEGHVEDRPASSASNEHGTLVSSPSASSSRRQPRRSATKKRHTDCMYYFGDHGVLSSDDECSDLEYYGSSDEEVE